ncbi:MAG: TatD family hydrolase [Sandaracinaceae bacterium]
MFDSHAHLDAVDPDRLAEARALGVEAAIVPGVEPAQWAPAIAAPLSSIRCGIAIGVHPGWAHEVAIGELDLAGWARRAGAVAIGELGWHRGAEANIEMQDELADDQLEVARSLGLPVILHVVGLHGHALERLARHGPLRGVVHGYSGSAELVPRYESLGLSIGIGPSVLRARAKKPLDAARAVRAEHLLVETDAPDQGAPADLPRVIEAVAAARGAPIEHVAETAWANAAGLFFDE